MQQTTPMMPMMPTFPQANITTEQIQKYLDENKKLILAILDNQKLGKLAECAQYQAQLQKNLMYLAAIADAQPQSSPTMPPQMAPHPGMQTGGFYMQHPQSAAAAMAQQGGLFSPKMPLQFNSPHQMPPDQQQQHQQFLQQQYQQAMQAQMGMRPSGVNNGGMMHHSHGDSGGQNKQDGTDTHGADGGGGDGDSSYEK
ncbi:GRF1-interacting factor 2-like [Impatiens glandulifera]|uniref:GRF1-interacting factor 2-like n=1 Tax=Impatiens glandulifera TaxID=253017 RepID=UPI001FB19A53|nr:GRF1-interacting factor 2-like [Impatiens glandulifera]XP_047338334.1 GRF1-interacting factor 2-like [Impatiens glandulifera]